MNDNRSMLNSLVFAFGITVVFFVLVAIFYVVIHFKSCPYPL